MMNELELIDDLVESLQQNKPNLATVKNSETKEQFFQGVFEPMSVKYEPHVLKNLRVLINHHLFNNQVGVDAVVHFLKQRNHYDSIILEREKVDAFDSTYGTKTGVIESTFANRDFTSDYELLNCTRTVPAGVKTMRKALDKLEKMDINLKDYQFMDVGSGMGRNLLIASLFPFKSVFGVEISQGINDIARNNIELFSDPEQKCFNVKSFASDILDFEMPNDNMVMFFFEPFSQSVFSKFYARMLQKMNAGHHYVLIFLGGVFQEIQGPGSLFELMETSNAEQIGGSNYELHFYRKK